MSCYISSNNERIYVALEIDLWDCAATITSANRIPLLKLTAKQVLEQSSRKDKTGSRTFVGLPNTIRRTTSFEIDTLMTEWTDQSAAPAQGPLFQAAMGGTPVFFNGGTVAAVTEITRDPIRGGARVERGAGHHVFGGDAVRGGD